MEKRNIKLYENTNNNKTFKLCHYQQEGICCLNCAKASRRDYFFYDYSNERHHYPSWKLISKNKKQWMPKQFKIEEEKPNRFFSRGEITW